MRKTWYEDRHFKSTNDRKPTRRSWKSDPIGQNCTRYSTYLKHWKEKKKKRAEKKKKRSFTSASEKVCESGSDVTLPQCSRPITLLALQPEESETLRPRKKKRQQKKKFTEKNRKKSNEKVEAQRSQLNLVPLMPWILPIPPPTLTTFFCFFTTLLVCLRL